MMTQLRARNAGPQNKIQIQMAKYNKIQIVNTMTISNGDLQKEYSTIYQYPDGCNADQGSLILVQVTPTNKIDCEHNLSPPITHTRP